MASTEQRQPVSRRALWVLVALALGIIALRLRSCGEADRDDSSRLPASPHTATDGARVQAPHSPSLEQNVPHERTLVEGAGDADAPRTLSYQIVVQSG